MNSYFTCSFCGATEREAKKIVAKGGKDEPAICSECVVLCVNTLINTSTTAKLLQRNEINPAPKAYEQGAGAIDITFEHSPGR